MKMRKGLLFLPFLLLLVGAFISCEEVEEAGKYDNWRERNEAFADSIKRLTGENYVATAEQADAMELGKLYAIQTTASTTEGAQYVYCKKLVKNETGERPLYTGYHSTVSAFYYGTLIVGDQFDGNFDGYSALDTNIPLSSLKEPTAFDSPTTFAVASVIPGWTADTWRISPQKHLQDFRECQYNISAVFLKQKLQCVPLNILQNDVSLRQNLCFLTPTLT